MKTMRMMRRSRAKEWVTKKRVRDDGDNTAYNAPGEFGRPPRPLAGSTMDIPC
jgi:hypothetical protein